MHIKGAGMPARDGAAMEETLDAMLAAGRAGRWDEYRRHLSALRDGLREPLAQEANAQLRQRLEMLGAAAPERDPEGIRAALEELATLLRSAQHLRFAAAAAAMDLRGLQPPEPILRIFQALERDPGACLRVILPHEPLPLYGLLRERGYAYSGASRPEGGFEVLIEPS
jgi:hypothetical protein